MPNKYESPGPKPGLLFLVKKNGADRGENEKDKAGKERTR
jgi:hypothetical protein